MKTFKTVGDVIESEDVNDEDKYRLLKTFDRLVMFYETFKYIPLWSKIRLSKGEISYIYKINIDRTLTYEQSINNYVHIKLSSDYIVDLQVNAYLDPDTDVKLDIM